MSRKKKEKMTLAPCHRAAFDFVTVSREHQTNRDEKAKDFIESLGQNT